MPFSAASTKALTAAGHISFRCRSDTPIFSKASGSSDCGFKVFADSVALVAADGEVSGDEVEETLEFWGGGKEEGEGIARVCGGGE